MNRERFTHQRSDSRQPLVLTYVRRPSYYAAFNSGSHLTERQRYGLGLVWSPGRGSVLQSQSGSAEAAWGTRATGREQVYEAADLDASFRVANRELDPEPGIRDLPDGELTATYSLGEAGTKTLRFLDDEIAVDVHHKGAFSEQIPLIVGAGDTLRQADKEAILTRYGKSVRIIFDTAGQAEVIEREIGAEELRACVVHLSATDHLTYRLVFEAPTTQANAGR